MKIKVAAAAPDTRPADVAYNKANILAAMERARADGAAVLLLPAGCLTGMAGDLEKQAVLQKAAEAAKTELLAAAGSLLVYPLTAPALRREELADAPREDLLLCAADSPATALSAMETAELAASVSGEKRCAVAVACPLGGSTTDYVYTGQCVIAQNGFVLADGEGYVCAELDSAAARLKKPFTATVTEQPKNPWTPLPEMLPRVLELQTEALARRLRSVGCQRAVLGVSGGLDSTLALLVACRAMERLSLPCANVLAVSLPCFGTTARTRSNAEVLAEQLGASFRVIDIKTAVELHFSDIGHDVAVRNAAYENAQARERTQVLMDLANDLGGLVVGTGDLSEAALGWCTYNGDHMSGYNVNGGVPKTVIRLVLRQYAATCGKRRLAAAIRDVLDTPVSPELLPPDEGGMTQLTEELVGPYELHDFYLYYFLRYGFEPRVLLRLAEDSFAGAYTRQELKHWLEVLLRRFFASQFKRSCSPDGPAVLGLSLSPRGGFAMPSDAVGTLWLETLAEA